jgi:DNA primase
MMGYVIDKETVKRNTDMLELVRRYMKLSRTGNVYQGLCPFHHEDTPSFTVYPVTQTFHCFGCGEHGDVLRFYQLIEKIKSFPEVLVRLSRGMSASCARPVIQQQPGQALEQKQKDVPIDEILSMYDLAYKMGRETLLRENDRDAKGVRAYLAERGFSQEDLEKLRIAAYLPRQREYFKQNYKEEVARKSGLISYGSGYNYRILIPQYDRNGRIAGLAFRLTIKGVDQEGKPLRKYKLTPLYDKDYPFNIYFAGPAIRAKGDVVVVEGHFDALALISMGVENVVALGGHSLNESHVRLFREHGARNIIVWLDNDDPGRNGTAKAVEMLLPDGKEAVFVVNCPFKDVGEINKEPDREKRKMIIISSFKSTTFGSSWLARRMTQGTSDLEKPRVIESGKEIYGKIPDLLQRQYFIKQFARGVGLKQADIERMFRAKDLAPEAAAKKPGKPETHAPAAKEEKPKRVTGEDKKRFLLKRLNDMVVQHGQDFQMLSDFLKAYYNTNKKGMPEKVKEVVILLSRYLKEYDLAGFAGYVSRHLADSSGVEPAVDRREGGNTV